MRSPSRTSWQCSRDTPSSVRRNVTCAPRPMTVLSTVSFSISPALTPASTTRYARLRWGSRSLSGGIAGWVWVPVSSGKPPPSPEAMTPYLNPKPGLLIVSLRRIRTESRRSYRDRGHDETPDVVHHPRKDLVVQRRQHVG